MMDVSQISTMSLVCTSDSYTNERDASLQIATGEYSKLKLLDI